MHNLQSELNGASSLISQQVVVHQSLFYRWEPTFVLVWHQRLFLFLLTPLEPQSRFGDKLLKNWVVWSPKQDCGSKRVNDVNKGKAKNLYLYIHRHYYVWWYVIVCASCCCYINMGLQWRHRRRLTFLACLLQVSVFRSLWLMTYSMSEVIRSYNIYPLLWADVCVVWLKESLHIVRHLLRETIVNRTKYFL